MKNLILTLILLFNFSLAKAFTPYYHEEILEDGFIIPEFSYSTGDALGVDQDYFDWGFFCGGVSGNLFYFTQNHYYQSVEDNHNEDEFWASNIGGGVRWFSETSSAIWGANLFYDHLEQRELGGIDQIGIGFERLSRIWDARLNVYLPVNNRARIHNSFSYPGGYFGSCSREINAGYGANFEIGRFFNLQSVNIYSAIGPYVLGFRHDCAAGVRYRAKVSYRGILAAEFIVTHDNVFQTNAQGIFSISIPISFLFGQPFGPNTFSPIMQEVDRFSIIPTKFDCDYKWNW